jgi:cysteine sulfinate desulfinase/cysteine desulfurase-like protein
MAMHKDEILASGAVRFSFSRYNTIAEVERLLTVLPDILSALAPEAAADALGSG